MTTLTRGRLTATGIPVTLPGHQVKPVSGSADTTNAAPARMLRVDRGVRAAARRSFAERARSPLAGGRACVRHRRTAATLVVVALIAAAGFASSSAAAATPPACPEPVIPSVGIIQNGVGCWNAIAVQTIRLATPYQAQGFIYMGYTQAAVYDAVTKIDGRYVPYHEFPTPANVNVATASPDAAAAAAADTILTLQVPGVPTDRLAMLATYYSNYISALGGAGIPAVGDGIAIGQAAAHDLIAERTGDRDESITYTPPASVTPGGWTFAPLPSLQSAQTPWIAVMKPFMLSSPSQFRVEPPPALSSRKWAKEFNETKDYGALHSTVRSSEQTAVARFWNANVVNQSNQAFQDVAIAHGMDAAEAARLLAMGDLLDSDAAMACWDSKYHYLFWRPVMAIQNAAIDGNPATAADSGWTPLLTTPNHPEYPAAHTCLTGAEAEMYAVVLGTHHIDVAIHGSADGTPNNWAAIHTFATVADLQREVANARVWAGLHYRGSALEGLELARNVTRWTLQRYFLPARCDRDRHRARELPAMRVQRCRWR